MTAETLHDALSLLPSDLITATDLVRAQPRKAVIHWHRWVSMAACAAVILGCGFLFAAKILPGMGGSTKEAAADMAAAECAPQEPAAPAAMEESASTTASDTKRYFDLDTIALTPTIAASEAEEAASGSSINGAGEDIPTEGCTSETQAPKVVLDLVPTQYILTPTHRNSSVNTSGTPQTVLIQSRAALETYYAEMSGLYDLASFYESCRIYDEVWFEAHDLLVLRLAGEASESQYEVTGFEVLENCEPQTWEICLTRTLAPEDNTLDENIYWHILLPVEKGLLTTQDIILVEMEEAS